jgi:hypothetical protein
MATVLFISSKLGPLAAWINFFSSFIVSHPFFLGIPKNKSIVFLIYGFFKRNLLEVRRKDKKTAAKGMAAAC